MFKPLKDKVVIKRDESKEEIGGIVIPETAQNREIFGTVISVGSEALEDLEPGQRVFFGKGDGVSIPKEYFTEPGDYIIMSDSQIRGIVYAEAD